MVIPMPSGGSGLQGDTNLEAQEVKVLKYTVLVVLAGTILQLVNGEGLPLNEMFYIIAGIFLLKGEENPIIKGLYDCLLKTPLGQCAGPNGGGMSCLMPLMFMGGLNLLFALMGPKGPGKLLCMVAQAVGVFFAYRLWQQFQGTGESGVYSQGDGNRASGGGGFNNIRQINAAEAGQAGADNAPATGFVAFQGEGNKLGN
jgi:hypothetical protein